MDIQEYWEVIEMALTLAPLKTPVIFLVLTKFRAYKNGALLYR